MDNVSVSTGVFVKRGSYKIGKYEKKTAKEYLFNEQWYMAYKEVWSKVEKAVKDIHIHTSKQILSNLHKFVSQIGSTNIKMLHEIPTAVILTGVNLPDHDIFFEKVIEKIQDITPYVACVWSRNCNNIKNMTEETISQFMNCDDKEEGEVEVPRARCTFQVLRTWYLEMRKCDAPLVVIVPDFESVSETVLHDFIYILSLYMKAIKFTLILGVATTVYAVHKSLTYDVTSKLRIEVFQTQSQVTTLTNIIEGTVMSPEIPFHLTGNVLVLLTDIFLFHDLSARAFLQNYKACMIKHFYGNHASMLCCKGQRVEEKIRLLNQDEISEIKSCPSIAKYMEGIKGRTKKGLSDKEFKDMLIKIIKEFHKYMNEFLTLIRCLHCLMSACSTSPLGRQLREIYATAVSNNLSETKKYTDSMKLLQFLSKRELVSKLEDVVSIAQDSKASAPKNFVTKLKEHIEVIRSASMEAPTTTKEITVKSTHPRLQFKEKLQNLSKSRSPFEEARKELIDYLDKEIFSVGLRNPTEVPGYDIFCFSDKIAVRKHIQGSVRAAIYTALNDPQKYLKCKCCKIEDEGAILPTMLDICIIYKLHKESTKLINVYDWLQGFLSYFYPEEEEEQRDVDPIMQARFTQAMSHLEFLGFISRSNRKMHHVKKLT